METLIENKKGTIRLSEYIKNTEDNIDLMTYDELIDKNSQLAKIVGLEREIYNYKRGARNFKLTVGGACAIIGGLTGSIIPLLIAGALTYSSIKSQALTNGLKDEMQKQDNLRSRLLATAVEKLPNTLVKNPLTDDNVNYSLDVDAIYAEKYNDQKRFNYLKAAVSGAATVTALGVGFINNDSAFASVSLLTAGTTEHFIRDAKIAKEDSEHYDECLETGLDFQSAVLQKQPEHISALALTKLRY